MQSATKMHYLNYYATTLLLNIGYAPNVKLTVIFFLARFSVVNSLTYP